MSRRVVVHHGGRHTVLPVPLTGGSLLGPTHDPALDHKVELLEDWWREHYVVLGPGPADHDEIAGGMRLRAIYPGG